METEAQKAADTKIATDKVPGDIKVGP